VFRDPGTGSIDLAQIIALLESLNFQGPVICSARQTRDPFRALLRMRATLNNLKI
jgi:inosose dehydratase